MQGIYKIQNMIDGKIYYGSSTNIERRFEGHRKGLESQTHHNILLQRAWLKHGAAVFVFEIIELVDSKDQLCLIEQTYIDSNVGGYNLAPAKGGDIISTHPDKDKIVAKMKASLKKRYDEMDPGVRKATYSRPGDKNPNWKPQTHIFCPHCEKRIQPGRTTCNGCRDRSGDKNSFYGKAHSQETRTRMSQFATENSWIRGVDPKELSYTKQYRLTYADGTVETYYGLKIIAEKFGVSLTAIHAIIKRGRPNYRRGNLKGILIEDITPPLVL